VHVCVIDFHVHFVVINNELLGTFCVIVIFPARSLYNETIHSLHVILFALSLSFSAIHIIVKLICLIKYGQSAIDKAFVVG
jgi:hypothetical protein